MLEKPLKYLSPKFLDLVSTDLGQALEGYEAITSAFSKRDLRQDRSISMKEMCLLAAQSFMNALRPHGRTNNRQDGLSLRNVKSALALALTFLRHNDILIHASEIKLFQMALETAAQEISPEEFSEFLNENAQTTIENSSWKML